MAATVIALRREVTVGCRALHYCGHGSAESLSFENGHGCAHEVTPGALRDVLGAGGARTHTRRRGGGRGT
jgi:hypothetical protein